MSSDHWKVKVVSKKWKWPVSAILIKIRLPSWAVLVQETPSKSLRCKIRWMDVKIIINPRKSTDWNFPLRNIHCFTSWSWFPAILLSQHKSKDQKRGSTKYCFALVRNVGAGLTNHRLIIVLTCLSCATYVVSKVFHILIWNSKHLKIINSQFSESGCSSGPSAPSASDQELGCSDLVHHDSGSEEGIIENLYHRWS